jgi:glycosyltransferase involved in cell wall biosynthesis
MAPKVCILSSTHSPFDTRIFYKQARSLVEKNYQITLIAPYFQAEVRDGVKIKPAPVVKGKMKRIFILPFRIFSMAVKERADVYHFHDPDLLLIAYLLKHRTNSRIIYDVHEDYSEVIKSRAWIPKFIRPVLSFFFDHIEKWLADRFDGIITVTDQIQSQFSPEKTIVVRNYPVVDQWDSTNSSKYLQHDQEDYKLIYVGDLTRVRGLVEIVQALDYLRDDLPVRLSLIGRFSEEGLHEEIMSLPGYQLVDHLGRKPHSEIPGFLTAADIGLVCLRPLERYREALPVKMFEYMAAGLPVVASDFRLWKKILSENNCGLVADPRNPRKISDKIRYLIEHPQERLMMGKNGKKAVQAKYNWNIEAEKMLQKYQELLG